MNKLVHIAAAGTLLAFGAAAQDAERVAKMKAEADVVKMKMVGAVRGMTVKGAPYSAEEVNETNQVLADGTRIHRENRTTVYRDSEGRTRRETPDNITITDPVANVTYFLDAKAMTGQKLTMAEGNFAFIRSDFTEGIPVKGEGPSTFSFTTRSDGPATITVNGAPLDEKAVAEAMAKAKASGSPQTFTQCGYWLGCRGKVKFTLPRRAGPANPRLHEPYPRQRSRQTAYLRHHFPPRRRQDHLDRASAAAGRRHPCRGPGQGARRGAARQIRLDEDRAGARHLGHLGGDDL